MSGDRTILLVMGAVLSAGATARADAHGAAAALDVAVATESRSALQVGTAGLQAAWVAGPGGVLVALSPTGNVEAGAGVTASVLGPLRLTAAATGVVSSRGGWSGGARGLVSVAGFWGRGLWIRPSVSSSVAWIAGSESTWLAPVAGAVEVGGSIGSGPLAWRPWVRLAAGLDLLSAQRPVARAEASVGLALSWSP